MEKTNYLDMKRKAVMYYKENKVPQKLEELLNTMFIDNPDDIYGYLSEYFGKFAKPVTISQITCRSTFNKKGSENMTASISCCINGIVKHILDLPSLADNSPYTEPITARMKSAEKACSKISKKNNKKESSLDHISSESLNSKPKTPLISFERFSMMLQQDFIPMLLGCEVFNQTHVDTMLRDAVHEILAEFNPVIDSNIPKLILPENSVCNEDTLNTEHHLHPNDNQETKNSIPDETELHMSSLFLSLLVAMTTAKLKELPLYKSLIVSMEPAEYVGCSLPLPAISVVSCEPCSPGKLMMFKEILVSPKLSVEPKQGINMIMKLSSCLEQTLYTKFGASGLVKNSSGIYTPPIDKPEHVFELLSEIATAMKMNLKEQFDIIVDINASQLYDEEKSKYDVILGSTSKTSETLIEMYKDWIEHYPIVAIIDGLAKKEEDGMARMFQELSTKCGIYSSETKEDIALKLISDEHINGMVIQPEKTSNLTDLFSFASSLNSTKSCHLMISDKWCTLQNNTAVVDLGVALNASYILIGLTSSFLSLSRLLQIYHELDESNELIEKCVVVNDGLLTNTSSEDAANAGDVVSVDR